MQVMAQCFPQIASVGASDDLILSQQFDKSVALSDNRPSTHRPAVMSAASPALSVNNSSYSPYATMQFSASGADVINNVSSHLSNAMALSSSSSPIPHIDSAASLASYNSTSTANSSVAVQKDVCGTTYFYTQDYEGQTTEPAADVVNVPHFTVYPGILPHVAHLKIKSSLPSFFMSDELKLEILNRQVYTALHLDDSQKNDNPSDVDHYHGLYPLEPPPAHPMHKSNTFGYQTTVYKAVNSKDNLTYCLRRIHGYRLVNTKCMSAIEQWKKIQHPNLVHLREVFTTKAFGDNSMVFVYDYHPAAETLMQRHFGAGSAVSSAPSFTPSNMNASPFRHPGCNSQSVLLPEALIWTYIVQLSSILRVIHAHGLACRVMDPTKILLTDKTRMRLNCVGIFDVLNYDSNSLSVLSQMEHYQQEDLVSLGRVLLALANNSIASLQNLQNAMVFVSRTYSADLKNLILYLMTQQARPRNINDIMPMIGARFYSQLEASHIRNDILENELSKEVENGRLFKLLCKLGTINERHEHSMDSSWSETGDRYVLKLFRDYVFHQVDSAGLPWIDMAHVIQCLNKLNAGVPEKICLSSRDDDIVLLVSYAELKRCIENAFADLMSRRVSATRLPAHETTA